LPFVVNSSVLSHQEEKTIRIPEVTKIDSNENDM
jgi:hypothetical protein